MFNILTEDCIMCIIKHLDSIHDISSLRYVIKFDWELEMIMKSSLKKLKNWCPTKKGKCCHCHRDRLTMIMFKSTCISWIPYCELHAPDMFLKEFELFLYSQSVDTTCSYKNYTVT
jgi:hypothetical protein